MATKRFKRFADFYPYYLQEHTNTTCRLLHFIGSLFVLVLITYSILTGRYILLLGIPTIGYGFAWVGHYFFEHNRPATFIHPLYSLMGDWVMFKDILVGKVSLCKQPSDKQY